MNTRTKERRAGSYGVIEETIITAIRKTVTAAGCTAVLLATAAACGTVQNLTAGQKVDHAVDRLGEQKSLAFQLDLDADADAINALAGEAGPDEALPPEAAKFFSGLRVDVSVKSKKPLADSGEKDIIGTSMKITGSDGVLVEYRVVGDFTYYRADMKAVGAAMGVPMPSADDLPAGEKEMRKVLEGDWVKVDTKKLEKAQKAQKAAGGASKGDGADDIDAKTQKKILDAVSRVIAHEVTFRTKNGADGVEHVVATGNFRDLLTGVFDKLRPLQDELPEGAELPSAKDLKDAPNKKVAVDFTLKNGDLRQIRVDLSVLADGPKKAKLPLVLKFSRAGDISAPSGATEMPVDKVPGGGALGGAFLGGGEF
ncbi:hypothetical protein ABZX90_23285 [Streptomyces sp. NPDC002935]|uniref:hypothetical protein n=1 Tax=Streptomyces sp. NPDC002935 TaxID=3154545 RepID=UPI00339FF564